MATPVLLPHNILVSGGSAPKAAAIYNYISVIFYTRVKKVAYNFTVDMNAE